MKKVGTIEKEKRTGIGKDRRPSGFSPLKIGTKPILMGQPKGTLALLAVEASSEIVIEEVLWLFPTNLDIRRIILQKPVRLVTLLNWPWLLGSRTFG